MRTLIHISRSLLALVVMAGFVAAQEAKPYPYPLSPREALKAAKPLETEEAEVTFKPGEAELKLLTWMEKRTELDAQQWAEAFLIASGESDKAAREKHLKQLDKLTEALRAKVEGKSPAEQAEAILKSLHEGAMSKGYVSGQSSLPAILDTGSFNCVSSTVLFHIQAARMGLKVQAIEFPGSAWADGHVMTTLVDGTKTTDIETTNPDGFDARAKIAAGGGYAFGIKDLKDGRSIDEVGLILSLYNNRAVEAAKSEHHYDALRLRLLMLAIRPGDAEQQTNAEAGFFNWVNVLTKAKQYERALAVGKIGMSFAPKSDGLNNNLRIAYTEFAEQLIRDGKDAQVAAMFAEATRLWPDAKYADRHAEVYAIAASEAIRSEAWDGAIDLLERGLKQVPDHRELHNVVAYLLQECLAKVDSGDPESAVKWHAKIASKFPKTKDLPEVALSHAVRKLQEALGKRQFEEAHKALADRATLIPADKLDYYNGVVIDEEARLLADDGEWEKAIKVYLAGLKSYPKHEVLSDNAPIVYDTWARKSMDKKNWKEAIEVYNRGLERFPNSGLLKQNREYCEYQLRKE